MAPSTADKGRHQWGFDRSYGIYTGGSNHWNQGVFHVNLDDPEVAAQVEAGVVPKEPFYDDGKEVERPAGIYSDNLSQRCPFPSTANNELSRPWSELSDEENDREARTMATYSAMMESQDYQIGILLNYPHETGQRDNTLVIYMADNGPAAALHYVIHQNHDAASLLIGDGPGIVPSVNGSIINKAVDSGFWRMMFQITGAKAFVEGGYRLACVNYVPSADEVADYVASYDGRIGAVTHWFKTYPENFATLDPHLAALDLPVQLFWGDLDEFLLVDNAHRLHERLPRNRLQVFERSDPRWTKRGMRSTMYRVPAGRTSRPPPPTNCFHIVSSSSSSRNERSTNKLRMLWRNKGWLESRANTGPSTGALSKR